MQIEFQNQTDHIKSLTSQAGGLMPLLMGPLAATPLTPEQLLAYDWQIKHFTESRLPDNKSRLVISGQWGDKELTAQECSFDQLLDGFRQGVFGPEVQKMCAKYDAQKAKHAAEMKAAQAERDLARREVLARAGL